jgi:PAS domain S-box-containing protein
LKGFFASDLFGTLFGDVFGNIFEVNDEYLRIIGYTRDDFNSGRLRWDSITPEEFLQLDMESINEAKIRGACAPYEKQYIRKDGSRVWVLVGFVLFGDNRDESIAFIIDLTELKQKELEIRQLNEKLELRVQQRTQELEVANRELEAFAYSVSHDLRAPLRAIDGFSRIILDEYADVLDEEGQRLLGIVRENTSRMDQLITDLLALSRATRLEMKSIPIDMRLMAESVFNQVQYNYDEHPSELVLEDLPLAIGDPNLIQQVWVNLISNALKYSRPREFSRVEIACEAKDGMQIYSVRDNGVGFNPAYINKLFGVFQRLHSAEEFEGTGVGLAIVQRIIHRHGGRVWAEAEVGKGATFYFSLPIKTG